MRRHLVFVGLLLIAACCSHAQTTNGRSSKLSAANLTRLRKSGLRIMLPTYVPTGFKPSAMNLNVGKDRIMSTFTVEYKNGKGGMFRVQMASEGIGDPMFDLPDGSVADATGTLKANSPVLGKVGVEFLKKGKIRMFQCTWVELKGPMPHYVMAHGEGIDGATGKRIIEGLRFLKWPSLRTANDANLR